MKILTILLILFLFLGAGSLRAEDNAYLVGGGDVLKIAVYDNPDLSVTARVNSDGSILFPLVGQVKIGGLNISQVAKKIAHVLADGYIVNPQVSVFVQEFRSKKVVIMGQIAKPGLYELSGTTSLLELISKAGGVTADAGEKITIKRKTPNNRENVFAIDLQQLMEKGADLDIPIVDGDNIFVSKAGTYYVTGQVNKPDGYKFEEGTSVIKAITMAGGFTNLAAEGKIKIIRKIKGKEHILEHVSMHEPVLPEDVIVIPESFF